MDTIDKILYTTRVDTTGGRDGAARSDDGRLDIRLSTPGGPGAGTNPEQLFAACWSACFIGAMTHVARAQSVALPKDILVHAEVDLGTGAGGYALQARLTIHLPGLPGDVAEKIVEGAHATCPYSKATRGNVAVTLDVA